MAKVNTYLVGFCPAQQTEMGLTMEISTMARATAHEVSAASFADLETEVRRLAHEFGQSCTPIIRLKDRNARKPSGFDSWINSHVMRFIEFVPSSAAIGDSV